jgi:hypothetical protein
MAMFLLTLAVLASPAIAQAQRSTAPDFKVVYWVERAKVGEGLQAKVFDLRKKEFTQDWDKWAQSAKNSRGSSNASHIHCTTFIASPRLTVVD